MHQFLFHKHLIKCKFLIQLIDEAMQTQEKLKRQKLISKSQVDDFESEINEIKKKLNTQQKDVVATQKQVTAVETKLEQKRADRHSLLKACKVRIGISNSNPL